MDLLLLAEARKPDEGAAVAFIDIAIIIAVAHLVGALTGFGADAVAARFSRSTEKAR